MSPGRFARPRRPPYGLPPHHRRAAPGAAGVGGPQLGGLDEELRKVGAAPHILAIDSSSSGLPIRELLDVLDARVQGAELALIPKSTVKVEGGDAKKLLNLMEALEELDDVAKVSSNFDIDADAMAEVGG